MNIEVVNLNVPRFIFKLTSNLGTNEPLFNCKLTKIGKIISKIVIIMKSTKITRLFKAGKTFLLYSIVYTVPNQRRIRLDYRRGHHEATV